MAHNNHHHGIGSIRKHMEALLAQISQDYDFSHCTLDSFSRRLEQKRERRIEFVPWPMPASLFGAWFTTADAEFIFYDQDAVPVHQDHIKLHELAHILCGHKTLDVDDMRDQFASDSQLRWRAAVTSQLQAVVRLRASYANEQEELEAETLALLIHEQMLRRRLALQPAQQPGSGIVSFLHNMEVP